MARLHDLLAEWEVDRIPQKAGQLDEWLDTSIAANGLTRRERLSAVSLPEPLAHTLLQDNRLRELYKTGTMEDLGIAPQFRAPPE